MSSNKITFKKEKAETGLRSVGHPYRSVHIKHNKKWIGYIQAPSWSQSYWIVRLTVKQPAPDNPNCDWMWIELGRFGSEEEARAFVTENTKFILARELHYRDPEPD